MTRIRPGAGNGSWSAACRTRVARSASIAIGLSKSAIPPDDGPADWSATRLLRSRSPGSVIAGPSCSALRVGAVPRETVTGPPAPHRSQARVGTLQAAGSPLSTRHDHHGSGSIAEVRTDSPGTHVAHPGGGELGQH